MKHNNVIANQHFRKDWQRFVKTWFDQPAKKANRRALRKVKADRLAPRPLNALRPLVRGQSIRYNSKVKPGRGFTLEELRAAKIAKKEARGIGIAVDHRRKNRSNEGFQANVNRLKLYSNRLVVFPRRPTSKRIRKGDATREECKAVDQVLSKQVLPIPQARKAVAARAITKEERDRCVTSIIRKARTDAKLWGQREKRAQEKADKVPKKKK